MGTVLLADRGWTMVHPCIVLDVVQGDQHLGGFHHVGAGVHGAALKVFVGFRLCHVMAFHQEHLGFFYSFFIGVASVEAALF